MRNDLPIIGLVFKLSFSRSTSALVINSSLTHNIGAPSGCGSNLAVWRVGGGAGHSPQLVCRATCLAFIPAPPAPSSNSDPPEQDLQFVTQKFALLS